MHLYVQSPSAVFLFFWLGEFIQLTKETDQIINQGEAISDNWIWVSSKAFMWRRSEEFCD